MVKAVQKNSKRSMSAAIIILNYNTKDLSRSCLESIFNQEWMHQFDVWVVDNASSDGSAEMISECFPKVKLIKSQTNLGFAGGNNLALRRIKSDQVVLLNSDTQVKTGSIDNLLNQLSGSGFDILSCKLTNLDGSLQPNAGDLPFGLSLISWLLGLGRFLPSFHRSSPDYYKGTKGVGWVSGSVMAIKQEVFTRIGFLDEKIFMYAEDVDFCIRANNTGFKIGWTDQAEIVHLGGGSLTDPHFRQRLGEFQGLIYLCSKYYGDLIGISFKVLLYPFILLRILAFLAIGRLEYSYTYAKILLAL